MSTSISSANRAAHAAFEERFGRQVAQRLSSGTADLPHDFSERLRAARMQALAKRKVTVLKTASTLQRAGSAAVLGGGVGWWGRIGALVPLIALVVGLITIRATQETNRARDEAEVDAALLTDDLPPAAFTDPGFAQFLKSAPAVPTN